MQFPSTGHPALPISTRVQQSSSNVSLANWEKWVRKSNHRAYATCECVRCDTTADYMEFAYNTPARLRTDEKDC